MDTLSRLQRRVDELERQVTVLERSLRSSTGYTSDASLEDRVRRLERRVRL